MKKFFKFLPILCSCSLGFSAGLTYPQIESDSFPQFTNLYNKAWTTAAGRVKDQAGLPQSPYMDEACWDSHIWIWDTAFMAFFTKYSPVDYPGVESLKNFYLPMHDQTGQLPLRIQHPDNPPLFAWAEYNNFIFNGATSFGKGPEALKKTLHYLKAHYEWFNSVKRGSAFGGAGTVLNQVKDKKGQLIGYQWNGVASGMDNTTRGRGTNGQALWIDAIAQQALSALYISRLASVVDDQETTIHYRNEYQNLSKTITDLYWDDVDGIYYDITVDVATGKREFVKVLTPASFWPMLAEIPTPKQAKRMARLLQDDRKLGGEVPVVTLSRDDRDFNAETGDYWRGGIWLPTSYMTVKALEKYKFYDLAREISLKTLNHMQATYTNPQALAEFNGKATIWECYSPTKAMPSTEHGRTARPEFCGWSALGPISMFIEQVLGFHEINSLKRHITWRKTDKGRLFIQGLRFGEVTCDILAIDRQLEITSSAQFTLTVNGQTFKIKAGKNKLTLK